jgi:hypothetical protein
MVDMIVEVAFVGWSRCPDEAPRKPAAPPRVPSGGRLSGAADAADGKDTTVSLF